MKAREPKPNGQIVRMVDVIAALMKWPRTISEITDYCDLSEWKVRALLESLRAAGVVYISGWKKSTGTGGRLAAIYSMQKAVFDMADVPKPSDGNRKPKVRRVDKPRDLLPARGPGLEALLSWQTGLSKPDASPEAKG